MKKLLFIATSIAALFFTASCQQENLEPEMSATSVTYTVEVPQVETKAIGDGANVNQLIYEVWRTAGKNDKTLAAGNGTERLYVAEAARETDGKFRFTVDLVQDQNYTILFWAQVKDAGYYNTSDLKNVTFSEGRKLVSNNDERAAFYGIDHIVGTEPKASETVELTRPFAQINLGSVPRTEEQDKVYKLTADYAFVKVTGAATSFNVATATAGEETTTWAFGKAEDPSETLTVNKTDYDWVAMNYIFVPKNQANVTVDYMIYTNHGDVTNTVLNVPVQKNYRTNIVGNLLTSKTEYTVELDTDWYTPEYVIGQEWSQTGNYTYSINEGASADVLKDVLEHADQQAKAAMTTAEGPVVTIDLKGDVYWETMGGHGSSPLLPADSPISAVVINGNGKTFTATGAGVGAIALANAGKLTFNNVNIVDESVSYNENAWEFTYLEFAGLLEFNNCTFNSGVQFQTETYKVDEETTVVATLNASFVNCQFITNEDSVYAVWVSDGTTVFEKCTFEGTRGLKMHEDYGSEVTTVLVDGCTFKQISKKPGVVIGDLNAETSVTIKNSTFDRCQAGDQNNYMYESDTDVTAFKLVLENNTVIPSEDVVVKQEDGSAVVTGSTALTSAIEEGYTTIKLAQGIYVIPNAAQGKTLTFVGLGNPEDTKIATNNDTGSYEGCNYALDGSTVVFENISINTPSTTYIGYARCNGTYRNCVINGTYTLYGVSVFEDCTFNVSGDVYNIWTWGAPAATFTKCTFNSDGKALLLYTDGQASGNHAITVNECIFNDKGGLSDLKAAIEVGAYKDNTYTLTVNNTTVNGYEVNNAGTVTGTTLWANKNSMPTDKLSVTIDGLTWIGGRLYKDAQGNILVNSAEALDEVDQYVSEGTHNVKVIKDLVGDATIAQAANTVINVDGQNHSYKGVITVDGKSATYTTAGLTIKNLTFDAETISTDACIRLGDGSNATRYTCNVTVENCTFDVPGAVGVKSYTGGDKKLTIKGCTVTNDAHSLVQVAGVDDLLIKDCKLYSKNGMNFNQSTGVVIDNCTADVTGYAARFGASSGNTGVSEVYTIKNSSLKSACDDGDAVIILRGTADKSTLTITSTTLEGTSLIQNKAADAKVIIDGNEYVADGVTISDDAYFISKAAGLVWFANQVNVEKNAFSGKTVKLAADVDLAGIDWEPIGQTGATTFNGVFDGQNYTISNLSVDSEDQTGAHYSSGLFGWVESHSADHGHIKNVKISGATIKGHHNCGALVGYITQETALVENCHVTGATISCTYANGDADGDKAGALIGNATVATPVKDCSAANSTVSSGRDAGQVIGAANEANVTGCSATDVSVMANGTGSGANVRSEVIGRLLK